MKIVDYHLDYSVAWTLPDIYLFTGNRIVTKAGALVMGRGAARQLRDSWPGIDHQIGKLLTDMPKPHVLFTIMGPEQFLGWFQVKNHWMEDASLELIQVSTHCLKNIAQKYPSFTFHMNYPGIGNGRLLEREVKDTVQTLPDNVLIYR